MQFTGQFNARFYVVELVIQAETKLGRIRIVVGSWLVVSFHSFFTWHYFIYTELILYNAWQWLSNWNKYIWNPVHGYMYCDYCNKQDELFLPIIGIDLSMLNVWIN